MAFVRGCVVLLCLEPNDLKPKGVGNVVLSLVWSFPERESMPPNRDEIVLRVDGCDFFGIDKDACAEIVTNWVAHLAEDMRRSIMVRRSVGE